jgi:hypothetical protein
MKIKRELPQFTDERVLIMVTGEYEARLYLGHDGILDERGVIHLPKPRYSDREGLFKVRAKRGKTSFGVSAGSTLREVQNRTAKKEFRARLKSELKRLAAEDITRVYLFTPAHVRNEIEGMLPALLRRRLQATITGLYTHLHPFEVLKKIGKRP